MPTYEYACKACGEHLEVVQSFKDDSLTTCPACGGALRKVFGSIGIAFKGSGFYRTDSRSAPAKAEKGEKGEKGEKKAASAEGSSSAEKASGDGKPSSDAKPSSAEKSSSDAKGGSKAKSNTSAAAS
jgi:putative FmdB family regulatory protein